MTNACQARLRGQALIDSLLKELPNQKEDTAKVAVLNILSSTYAIVDPEQGIKYGNTGKDLAEKLDWKKGIGHAYYSLGMNYLNKSDYPKALDYNFKSVKIAEETGDSINLALSLTNIGNTYYHQSKFTNALENYLKALKIAETTSGKNKAITLRKKEQTIAITMDIGNIYDDQGEYAKAYDFYSRALSIANEINDSEHIAIVTGNIGNNYFLKGDHEKALEFYLNALKINEALGNKLDVANMLGNIGAAYTELGSYTHAICFGLRAVQLNKEIGDERQMAYAQEALGEAYFYLVTRPGAIDEHTAPRTTTIPAGKTARLELAIQYLQQSLEGAKKMLITELLEACYQSLAKAYKEAGDYKQALENHERYVALKDSLFSKENARKLMEQQMQYDYDKKTNAAKAEQEKKDVAQRLIRNSAVAGMAGLIIFSTVVFRQRNKVKKEKAKVESEKMRSDNLLLNILPAEVADELKTKGTSAAQHFENVTVLFTDIVNFTSASEKMSAQELIDELHACFKAFDEITTKHNIEKIKTIGDAYLAVCGLPVADEKHAVNVVAAAMEINDFMLKRYGQMGDTTFEMRIGIHSGSVVAGIVGVKKFAYDIWGDTVNTAARMEQNSEAGKINISERTFELVKNDFNCVYRGELDVKNKGMMKMYWVTSPRPSPKERPTSA